MTAAAIQRTSEPGVRPVTWSVTHDNTGLGLVEMSPAGNHYAFVSGKCLGLFKDLVEAGEAIVAHHGLAVELVR